MSRLRSILLVEDSSRDAESTLNAFEEHGLANDSVHVRDGVEAVREIGAFRAVSNEPPPRSAP